MALNHTRQGDGEPLLLVHGIGHSLACWDDVAPRLADDFAVYAVDLPGFGASPALAGTPTLPNLAGACAAFMAEQGHERFHVAGNSLGGGIALHLAFTGTALSAAGLSPVGFVEGIERAHLHATLAASRASAGAVARVIAGAPAPVRRSSSWVYAEHADRMRPQVLADTFAGLAAAPGFDATRRHALGWRCPSLDRLPAPVTVAWGEKDKLLLHGPQSRRARERLPQATHLTLEGCGHLVTWDDPEQVAAVVRRAATP